MGQSGETCCEVLAVQEHRFQHERLQSACTWMSKAGWWGSVAGANKTGDGANCWSAWVGAL
eukprot:11262637-Prorocentrum_lima.AAC.1